MVKVIQENGETTYSIAGGSLPHYMHLDSKTGMIRNVDWLVERVKELEQQLLEQAAYGVYLRTKIQGGKTIDANPSQALVNQMKAEAVREYGEHLSHAEDRLTPEDYAKQLEGGE